MNLELMAMRWLRFERRHVIVIKERSPRAWPCGRPDILGITTARHLTEIEIKRTVADFKADAVKPTRRSREFYLSKMPKLFYYLVPISIADKVAPLVPAWAGLLKAGENGVVYVVKEAPRNEHSKRLTVKECARLVLMVSNQIISTETSRESLVGGFRYGHEPYWQCLQDTYEI